MVRRHRHTGDGADRRGDSASVARPAARRAARAETSSGGAAAASRVVPVRDRAGQGLTRVALLTEIPAPYRIPLFNALADRVSLCVLFLRERHPDRPYDLHRDELMFDWRVTRGNEVTLRSHWFVLNMSVSGRLRHADVVILG